MSARDDDRHWHEYRCDLCGRRVWIDTALCSSCALDGLTEGGEVA